MIKRSVRTFFETALGYLCANLAVSFDGEGADGFATVLTGLVASAVAAGIAAALNLPKKQ